MNKNIIRTVPGVNIEDIPHKIAEKLWTELPNNGGNCICVDADSDFGKWLTKNWVSFDKDWQWIVVWR